MSRRSTVLVVFLFLLGIGIMAYPAASNWVNQLHGSYAIQEFQTRVENADIAAERQKAEEYNLQIRACVPVDGFTAEIGTVDDAYYDILNFGGGMMGYLRIPKIEVNLPIYHGTDEETLAKGVGHLTQSALPIGGEGNHSILTGHTGLPSAELFNNLTQLEEGDHFYIGILDDTLIYQVDQIKVVLPDEGQDLVSVVGKDYCTLVTCTPYGINTHRLLVRGERMMLSEAEDQSVEYGLAKRSNRYLWLIALSLTMLLLVILITLKLDISSYQ